jgi:hypothetical protein
MKVILLGCVRPRVALLRSAASRRFLTKLNPVKLVLSG